MAVDAPDWLTGLVSMIPVVGSWTAVASAVTSANQPTARPSLGTVVKGLVPAFGAASGAVAGIASIPDAPRNAIAGGIETSVQNTAGWAATAGEFVAEADPTHKFTGPVLAGLHRAGIGKPGDEWDKGAIGILGAGFSKVGAFMTYAATVPLPGSDNFGVESNKKAWDLAFDPAQGLDFGGAIMSGIYDARAGVQNSILMDPSGVDKLHNQLDSTYYGNGVAGLLSFGMYAVLDPTKGATGVLKAARASKYVPNEIQAARYSAELTSQQKWYHGTTDVMDANIKKHGLLAAKGEYNNVTTSIERARAHAVDAAKGTGKGTALGGKPIVYEVDVSGLPLEKGWQGEAHGALKGAIEPDRLRRLTDDDMGNQPYVPTKGGGLKTTAQAWMNKPLDAPTVVSRQYDSKFAFHDMTDRNQIINLIEPRMGLNDPARAFLPKYVEVISDLGASGMSREWQAAAKLHVDYAFTGSTESMQWLAREAPIQAAKAMRVTQAPRGYKLIDDAFDSYRALGNDVSTFDLTPVLDAHWGTPAAQAEMTAYAKMVSDIEDFRIGLETGGVDGGQIVVGGSGRKGRPSGFQVVPGALEKTKTAFNESALKSYYLQDGKTGRTIRVIRNLNVASLQATAAGFVHTEDALLGNRQLLSTLKEYQGKVKRPDGTDVIDAAYIQMRSEEFLRTPQPSRAALIEEINGDLLTGVAGKYSVESKAARGVELTAESIRENVKVMNQAFIRGRQYASRDARAAVQRGDDRVFIGDVNEGLTTLKSAHLQTHFETTAPLLDWQTAVRVTDSIWKGNRLGQSIQRGERSLLHGMTTYNQWWKYAVLGRPGLVVRALLDTGTRAAMNIGAATYMMAALTGAKIMGEGLIGGMTAGRTKSLTGGLGPMTYKGGHSFRIGDDMTNAVGAMQAVNEARTTALLDLLDSQSNVLTRQGAKSAKEAGQIRMELAHAEAIMAERGLQTHHIDPATGRLVKEPTGPSAEQLTSMKVAELRDVAADLGIKSARMNKSDLIVAIGTSSKAKSIYPADLQILVDRYQQYGEVADRIARELMDETYAPPNAAGIKAPLGVAAVDKALEPIKRAEAGLAEALEIESRAPLRKPGIANRGVRHAKGTTYEVELRSIQGDIERKLTEGHLVGGNMGNGMAAAMLDQQTHWSSRDYKRGFQRYRVDTSNIKDVAATDGGWAASYAASMGWYNGSPTAQLILAHREALFPGAPQAVLDNLLDHPSVVAEHRKIKGGGTVRDQRREWLDSVIVSVKSVSQTQASRDLMTSGKHITPAMVEKAMPKVSDRFNIVGPDVVMDQTRHLIDNFFHVMLDIPDLKLARVPMYTGLYHANIKELLPDYMARARKDGRETFTPKEMAHMHTEAKTRAINDVRQDMYDVHRVIGAQGVMSVIAPFFAPWADAMMSWGRMMYDNPSIVGTLTRYANTPAMFGGVTDREGNKVRAFSGVPLSDQMISVPMYGAQGWTDVQIGLQSLNTIAQGELPWSPGVGPQIQLLAAAVVGQALPNMGNIGKSMGGVIGKVIGDPSLAASWEKNGAEFGMGLWEYVATHPDSVVNQTLFQGGEIPKADPLRLAASQLPTAWKKASDVFFGQSENSIGNIYPQAYGTRLSDLSRQFIEKNGKNPTGADLERIKADAASGAQAASIVGALLNFGLGLSGNAKVEGQMYVEKMHSLNQMKEQLKAQGVTPQEVFAVMYPSASNLKWTFSENEGRLEGSVNATTAFYKHRTLMDKYPRAHWWIAGADNILATLPQGDDGSGNPAAFSQSAYNQQMTAGLRRRFGKDDIDRELEIAMAQGEMDRENAKMEAFLKLKGLKTVNSPGAGNLSQLKRDTRAAIEKDFPLWAEWSHSQNRVARQDEINQIQTVAFDTSLSLFERADVDTTRKYLIARRALINYAASDEGGGVVEWQTAKRLVADRAKLWQWGHALAEEDIVFQMSWSRLFEREFDYDLEQGGQQ